MIVQRLRSLQEEHGYLPDDELKKLAEETKTPLYRIQEVASFFPHFRQEWNKPPYLEVQVCRDMSCHLNGSEQLLSAEGLGKLASHGDKAVHIEGTSCLGRCDRAPVVCINRIGLKPDKTPDKSITIHDAIYAGRTCADLESIIKGMLKGDSSYQQPDTDTNYQVNRNDDWRIDVYRANPTWEPYEAVRRLVKSKTAWPVPICQDPKKDHPHEWMKILKQARLLGMGGAGFEAYRKWSDVWKVAETEKYIVCNGDESEPGTFKDREILLSMPHLVVEGVILAGLLTHATAGYIYIRHEYTEQIESVRQAIKKAEMANACGENIFQSKISFPVEVFVSPGGYICGEQSALLEAMEDKRSQPRNRPPELSTNGLYNKPTVVNNVETLAWAPSIMLNGSEWYAQHKIAGYKGRRFFSISGDLNKPGVYEVPIGISLGELINSYGGGIKGGRKLQAVATSGPSGGLLPARIPVKPGIQKRLQSQLERVKEESEMSIVLEKFISQHLKEDSASIDVLSLPLDLNFFRRLNRILGLTIDMMLGAGLVFYSDARDLLAEAYNHTEFYRNESCGKCVPCRIGSQKLVEIGKSLLTTRHKNNALTSADLDTVKQDVLELYKVLQVTSICGLGVVAPYPLATYLEYFTNTQDNPASGDSR